MRRRRPFQVIGHRGARALFPENTQHGFIATAALGVKTFELDVGMTADDVVVVCHDPVLNPDLTRVTPNQWIASLGPPIRSLTLAELARYDVGRIRPGSRTDHLFPDQRPHDGARVPTLAAVLTALPTATFVIEVKTDPTQPDWTAKPDALADAVLSVVTNANAAARVVIESFDWRVQHHVRCVHPEIRLAWLTSAQTMQAAELWWDGVHPFDHDSSVPACVATARNRSMTAKFGIATSCPSGDTAGDAWAPEHATLTEAMVRHAHALNLSVLPWTVNQEDDMRRLIRWGVDGLISDRPDVVAKVADG